MQTKVLRKWLVRMVLPSLLLLSGATSGQGDRLDAPRTPIPPTYFGLHVGYPTDPRPYAWAGDYVPFGAFRLWDTADVGWSFIQRVGPQQIERVQRANGVVTVTTEDDHGMIPQATSITVEIRGVHDSSFDGRYTVTGVRGSRLFTFAESGADTTSEGGVELASDWTVLDGAIAKAKGKQILYTFGAVPIWATRNKPAAVQIDSIDRSDTLYTVTTIAPHGFRINTGDPQWVKLTGTPGNVLDGVYGLKAVPDDRTFTFEASAGYLSTQIRGGQAQLFDRGGGSDWHIVRGTHLPYSAATALEPDPQLFRDFVTQAVSRYCGCTKTSVPGLHIDGYEIWNEPNATGEQGGGTFFVPETGRTTEESADAMIPLAKIVWDVVEELAPQTTVVSPAASGDLTSNGIQWLNRFLDDGGGRYFGVLGYHFYVGSAPPEATVPVIAAAQTSLAAHRLHRPIWNTEMGWGGNQNPTAGLGPAYVARTYLLDWAAGASRVYWYQWENQCWVKIRMTASNALPPHCGNARQLTGITDVAQAYATIQKWLVFSTIGTCSTDSGNWICDLTEPNGDHEHILWRSSDIADFHIPYSWKAKKVTLLDGTEPSLPSPQALSVGPVPILVHQ